MNFLGVEKLLGEGVESGTYPAAVAGVAVGDEKPWMFAAGRAHVATVFDLASLTKVISTTTIAAKLVESNVISLTDRPANLLPRLPWHDAWSDITIQDLLTHQAGFVAWVDLRSGSSQAREEILRRIVEQKPKYAPRSATEYSDLGFIILGVLLENVTGRTLEKLTEEFVSGPLHCSSFTSRPLESGIKLPDIAPTENIDWRGGVLHGAVHDSNAFLWGGLAGHAGLFGNVADCLRFAAAWMGAILSGSPFLSKPTAELFAKPVLDGKGTSRALGWDIPSGAISSAGRNVSKRAIGHLGYTGASLWIDLQRKAVVVLLTNRVHPTSTNEAIKSFRPQFHDKVWEAIDG